MKNINGLVKEKGKQLTAALCCLMVFSIFIIFAFICLTVALERNLVCVSEGALTQRSTTCWGLKTLSEHVHCKENMVAVSKR